MSVDQQVRTMTSASDELLAAIHQQLGVLEAKLPDSDDFFVAAMAANTQITASVIEGMVAPENQQFALDKFVKCCSIVISALAEQDVEPAGGTVVQPSADYWRNRGTRNFVQS